ncbi:MAG: DUF4443 domain-containing protein, partial [Promethearchaeota archaeon]
LVFDGKNLIFPSKLHPENVNYEKPLDKTLYNYFQTQLTERNIKLKENDVIIIGSGNTPQNARLATVNAALTLI